MESIEIVNEQFPDPFEIVDIKPTKPDWDTLVTNVRSGNIVPVIGSEAIELYFDDTFDFEGCLTFNPVDQREPLLEWPSTLLNNLKSNFQATGGIFLYDYLIYKLLCCCFQNRIKAGSVVNYDEKTDLSKAAFLFLLNVDKDLRKKSKLRDFIRGEINYLKKRMVSNSMDILAQIPFFKLYVSLTIDDFLDLSLNNFIYFEKPERLENIKFANLFSKQDFADNKFDKSLPRLYHIYGTVNNNNYPFAVTEEEIIEYTCAIGTFVTKPENLINYVQGKDLLLIGCKYNDWLLGFLLRMITNLRIYEPTTHKLFADRSFTFCQTYLTKDYDIYVDNVEAIDFIKKLKSACVPSEGKKIEKGGVFISFHSKDRPFVEELKNKLVGNGIPVWFDEDGLGSGDDITPTIQDNIINSSVFVACISEHNKKDPRYFMIEWVYAKKVKKEYQKDKVIIPLLLDDNIPFNDPFIAEHFPDIKNIKLPKKQPQDDQPEKIGNGNTEEISDRKKKSEKTSLVDENSEAFKKLVSDLRSYVRQYRLKH